MMTAIRGMYAHSPLSREETILTHWILWRVVDVFKSAIFIPIIKINIISIPRKIDRWWISQYILVMSQNGSVPPHEAVLTENYVVMWRRPQTTSS